MGRRYDSVSFLTDWGLVDEFVGVVKAVIRDLAPHAVVIDLSHQIPPFDVRAGSLALARSISYLPAGIVLAVVDPGVGSSRRALAIEVADGEGIIVGPDNGLLAPAVAMAGGAGRAVELTNPAYRLDGPGATFAGRDIFAPAVAHLCNGVDLDELGDSVDPYALLPGTIPLPRNEGDTLVAEVLWVDHFGNCQLNVGPEQIVEWEQQAGAPADGVRKVRIVFADDTRVATLADNFSAIVPGSIGLVPDSCGMLAIVLDRRSASAELRLGTGDQVTLSPLADDGSAGPVTTSVTSPVTMRPSR